MCKREDWIKAAVKEGKQSDRWSGSVICDHKDQLRHADMREYVDNKLS